jgi:hypothetical protein
LIGVSVAEQLPEGVENNLFSNHFLEKRISEMDEWEEANVEDTFDSLRETYSEKKRLLKAGANEDETQKYFIDPVLQELGHFSAPEQTKSVSGNPLNPDYLFLKDFDHQMDLKEDGEDYFDGAYAVGDAKKWNEKLDQSKSDHTNPAFQIYNYVDRLRMQWGILTNGRKWRLYSYEDCAADVYYEVDLVELLQKDKDEEALEKFKYFYMFFRQKSFLPEEKGFIDEVFQGSIKYSQGLEEDLEEKVYSALESTARGFFETEENNLNRDKDLDEVHRSSLILLYRFIFILNAESRGLLPLNDRSYRESLSLQRLKEKLHEEETAFQESTLPWDNRIMQLFKAIDEGRKLSEEEIPAYNGGLFDSEKHEFLAKNKLRGDHIKDIIRLLAESEDQEGNKVLVDYQDLDIRHLGSIYEGLLEHELQKAEENLILESGEWISADESSKDFSEVKPDKKVQKDQVYLANESGERKATGSYYTPDYIVEYIVESTVGPKVDEKLEAAKDHENPLAKILEINVCDPAMGSGHFLTEATDFIAHRVVESDKVKLSEHNIEEDENELIWVKRQVVQNCIYGVDINPLAVELGKLSLWLETMAEGKPLNFLDHHLKVGNSLIGSDFEDLEKHPKIEERPEEDEKELFGLQGVKDYLAIEYSNIERKNDEETVEQIHEKEETYRQFINNDDRYLSFQKLANLHTYLAFNENELSPGEYSNVRNEVLEIEEKFSNKEWFQSAQQDAENRNYFHWQLEFPKVFFGEQKGFDAVVGNPPYVKIQNIPENQREYLEKIYDVAEERYDLYGLFTERGLSISGSEFGYILPSKFFESQAGAPLRNYLRDRKAIREIDSFEEYQVFDGVTTYTCLLFLSKDETESFKVRKAQDEDATEKFDLELFDSFELDYSHLEEKWDLTNPKKLEVVDQVKGFDNSLEDILESIYVGIQTSANDIFYVDKISDYGDLIKCETESGVKELEKDLLHPILLGKDIKRFRGPKDDRLMIYPYKKENGKTKLIEEDELREKYPKIYDYLSEHKEKLSDRGTESQEYESWYAHWCPRNFERKEKEKLLTPDVSMKGQFTYDPEGKFFFSNSAYSLVIEDEDFDYFDLMAVLNSKLSDFFLVQTAPTLRGGYHRNNTQYLFPISIPEEIDSRLSEVSEKIYEKEKKSETEKDSFLEWVEAEWGVDVDDLSLKTHLREYWEYDFDEFMRVAKKNKSQIDGSVKSREFRELMKEEWESSMDALRPLMHEIDELESEIDAIVFDLYDLTEEEVETVIDSLDMDGRVKKEILEQFREV